MIPEIGLLESDFSLMIVLILIDYLPGTGQAASFKDENYLPPLAPLHYTHT
jgi:hypothetical protein